MSIATSLRFLGKNEEGFARPYPHAHLLEAADEIERLEEAFARQVAGHQLTARDLAEARRELAEAKHTMKLVADKLELAIDYATKLSEKFSNVHAVGYLQSVIGSWLPRLRGEIAKAGVQS